jgi:cyclase
METLPLPPYFSPESRAIDEGRSVEATLEAVGMPDYGEYSLFERAHNSVNVPAACRHLQKVRGGAK